MIDELEIYGSEDSIFKDSMPDIINLYHISPNYGADLNTNNLEMYLKDDKYGLSSNKEYPICVCMPPRSRMIRMNDIWIERIAFNLFFLQKSYISDIDPDTNTSAHYVWQDWSEMKNAAMIFFTNLILKLQEDYDDDIRWKTVLNIIFDSLDITRLSHYLNDKISGVGINFSGEFNANLC